MSHRPVAASDQAPGTLTAARQPPSCTTTELSIEARRESYDSELTSHRHRCNQPSRARSECERVPRRNSRRARAQASSRYHQSAAQLAVTKGRPNMMYILASVSTWYWCVPWEGSTPAGAMELALEHSRHLPGASLRLRFSAVAQVGSRQTKRTRGSDSTEFFEMRAGGTRSADTGSELGTWSLRNPCLLIESIDARLNGSGCSICLSRSCAAGEGGCGPRSNDQRLFRMLSYVASSVPSVAWNGGIPQSRVYLKGRAVVYGQGNDQG